MLHRLGVAFLPLLIAVLAAWAVAAGPVSLGGGEKDIILVFPAGIWSVFYAMASIVYWRRGASLATASKRSALFSTALLLLLFGVLLVATWR